MQRLRLNKTFRIIGQSILSNNVNFVELGLSGYDEKHVFWAFYCEYLLQNQPFLWWKKLGGTKDTYAKKMNPPSIVFFEGRWEGAR